MTHLYFTGFDCLGCRTAYAPDQDLLFCPRCHHLLEARYDLARFGREVDRDGLARRLAGVWRWRELLPVLDPTRIVTLGEGGTPFLRSERLARAGGVPELWLKSDAANPTGSLKDRSITVAATKAMEFGYDVLSCDSTGNKASSTAAYAARAGLRSVVFCPKDTPVPKMAQAVFFGARLIRVDGHYSQINTMYRKLIGSGRVKWYDCGTDNPFRYEGRAVRLLAQEGLMIEPSGAVTVAAVRRGVQDGLIDRGESVVCVLTGSGFKDFDRILDLVEIPRQIVFGYEAILAEAERI
jgi:threonine synthase